MFDSRLVLHTMNVKGNSNLLVLLVNAQLKKILTQLSIFQSQRDCFVFAIEIIKKMTQRSVSSENVPNTTQKPTQSEKDEP